MYLVDAGPDGKQTRHARMREVVDGILQRVSGNLRFAVIGFYTESMPVVMEARDPELVRNVFNGLPLSYAMPAGQTDLGQAINGALKLVEDFPEGSTRVIILTDGDSVSLAPIAPRPKSVKEVFVLGVGNPTKGSFIDGHQSRQEGDTLRTVATALMGTYVDVNEKHLPTTALGDLVVTAPLPQRGLSLAEWAVLAMVRGRGDLRADPGRAGVFRQRLAGGSRRKKRAQRRACWPRDEEDSSRCSGCSFRWPCSTTISTKGRIRSPEKRRASTWRRFANWSSAKEPDWEKVIEEYDKLATELPTGRAAARAAPDPAGEGEGAAGDARCRRRRSTT